MTTFQIRSAILKNFAQVLVELGSDPIALFEKAKIPTQLLRNPDSLIPQVMFADILQRSTQTTGCDHLGLLLGAKANLQDYGLLGLLIRSSTTMEQAITELIQHMAFHITGISRNLHREGNIAYIASVFDNLEVALSKQAIQMSVAITWTLCRNLSQNLWHPTAIYFSFAEPANSIVYHRFFKIPVVFNAEFNGVVFHAKDLAIQLPEPDKYLHQEMQKQLNKQGKANTSFPVEVKRIIQKNLDFGICSIDAVVKFFPFQKRSFQTKLETLGVSYQQLLDEVRFQKAEFHLAESELTVSQLADLLCYRSVSVFSTAFRKKYGVSPTAWRKNHAKE